MARGGDALLFDLFSCFDFDFYVKRKAVEERKEIIEDEASEDEELDEEVNEEGGRTEEAKYRKGEEEVAQQAGNLNKTRVSVRSFFVIHFVNKDTNLPFLSLIQPICFIYIHY